jgi:hypothetical protein
MAENFNRKEAKEIIKRVSEAYVKEHGKRILDANTESGVANDRLLYESDDVSILRNYVEKALHSGMSAGEIQDKLVNATSNVTFQSEGTKADKQNRTDVKTIAQTLAAAIPSKGTTDRDLNTEYKRFTDDYLHGDWDKMAKTIGSDMSLAQRQRLLEHLKDSWGGSDGIKQTVQNAAKARLASGDSATSRELLETLGPYEGKDKFRMLSMFLIMPDMTNDEMYNTMVNFSTDTAAAQTEYKTNPPAATEDAGTGTGDSADPLSQTRTVYEQDRDGNWITGEKDWQGNWTSPPTIVGDDRALAAIARTDAKAQEALERADFIYARNRADNRADYEEDRGFQRRDVVTKRVQDLADIENLYTRQDENWQRDLEQGKLDYTRDIGREDKLYGRDLTQRDLDYDRDIARLDAHRSQDMLREDLIRIGEWSREDEIAFRNRDWNLEDRRDERIWQEEQQAEENVFKTGQLAMQMGPQYFQSQLDAANFEKDVLRNASDYISAAFMQRGEASPFKAVTQADLINGFRSKVRDMMQATAAGFRPPLESPEQVAAQIVGDESGTSAGDALAAKLAESRGPDSSTGGGSSAAAKAKADQAAKIAADKAAKLIADAKATADALLAKGGSAAAAAKIVADAKAAADAAKAKAAADEAASAPTGSYYDDTEARRPDTQKFVYGEDSPARRTVPREISEYERATAPSFRSPPVGSEFGADPFQPPNTFSPSVPREIAEYEAATAPSPAPVGSEFGASPFTPINRNINYNRPSVGSEIGDSAFQPINAPPSSTGTINYPPEYTQGVQRPPVGTEFGDQNFAPLPGDLYERNPLAPQENEFGAVGFVPPQTMRPSVVPQENEFGASNFIPPQARTPTPQVPNEISSYEQQTRPPTQYGDEVGYLGDVSSPAAEYQLPRMGMGPGTPPQIMQLDNYGRLMDYGSAGGQQDMLDPSYGGIDSFATQYPQTYQPPSRMSQIMGSTPQPVQDFSEGFEFEQVDQWPQNQYSPQYNTANVVPQPVQDFSEGFEFEQVNQWPQTQHTPSRMQQIMNSTPRPAQNFSEGFDFERVEQFPVNTFTPSFNTSNVVPQVVPNFSEGFDITDTRFVENYPVTPSRGIDRMSEIMQAAPVARATGQRSRYGTQPISRPSSVGFRPPEFEIY